MLRKAFIAIGLLLAVFLIYASTRPDTFEVKRSLVIHATAPEIFGEVNDFHRWADWSPWEKLDPNMTREFSGQDNGIGAAYAWSGNDQVGKGRMEITAVTIPYEIVIQLDFSEPFPARHQARFNFEPIEGDGTTVTWTMSGTHSKLSKLMSVFFNMDAMVGPDFEKGLANLKAGVEAADKAEPATVSTTEAAPDAAPEAEAP